jgi:serine/threonine protein kinase
MGKSDRGRLVGGKYQLKELAGEGGMATVWKGLMRGAGNFTRIVAIKKMKPEFHSMQNYIDMFMEEARVGGEMNHPNIVQVIDFLQDEEGSYYMIMEWIDGVDLNEFHKAFRKSSQILPWGLVAVVGIGALRALAAAHERVDAKGKPVPIIHRDVSPQNLLLSKTGEVKLTDFGLALAKDRVMAMTAPGMVKGKLSYLAPESLLGTTGNPRTDIFAVGTVLWESLSGKKLFSGDDDLEVYKKLRECIVPDIADERPGLPQGLVDIINKALAPEPADRFASAREFAHALSCILGGPKNSSQSQQVLARAVKASQYWMKGKPGRPVTSTSHPTWQEVETQFSSVSALPMIEGEHQDVDIWFSNSKAPKR